MGWMPKILALWLAVVTLAAADPDFAARLKRVQELRRAGQVEAARREMEQLEQLERPADLLVEFYTTRAYLADDPRLRIQNLEEALKHKDSPDLHLEIASAYLQLNQPGKARQELHQAQSAGRWEDEVFLKRVLALQLSILEKEERYHEAELLLRSQIRSARLAREPAAEAHAWLSLMRPLHHLGRFEELERSRREAYRLFSESENPDGQIMALTMFLENKKSAQDEQWLLSTLSEAAPRLPPPQQGLVYTQLGRIAQNQGDWERSEGMLARAVEVFESMQDQPRLVSALASYAWAVEKAGRVPEKALQLYRRVDALSPNHEAAVNGISRVLSTMGRYDELAELLQKRLAQKSLTTRQRAEVLSTALFYAQRHGDYSEQHRLIPQIVEILPTLSAPDQDWFSKQTAWRIKRSQFLQTDASRKLIAHVEAQLRKQIDTANGPRARTFAMLELAQYFYPEREAEALEICRKALREATASQLHEQVASIETYMTGLMDLSRDRDEILSITERRLQEDPQDKIAISRRVQVHETAKEYGEAIRWQKRSLEVAEKRLPHLVPGELMTLARLETESGNTAAAVRLYQQALSNPNLGDVQRFVVRTRLIGLLPSSQAAQEAAGLWESVRGGPNPGHVAEAAVLYARTHEKEGVEVLRQAVDTCNRLLEELPDSAQEQLRSTAQLSKLYETLGEKLLKTNPEEALRVFAQGRSAERVKHLRAQKVRFRDQAVGGLVHQLRQADSRQKFLTSLNELRQKDPNLANQLTVRGTELSAVQKRLGKDELVLQYYLAENSLHLFLIGPGQLEVRTLPVESVRVKELVARFRGSLASPQEPDSEARAAGNSLYSLLIEPVAPLLEGRRVYICPSGPLWYLPLESLPDGKAGYLAQHASFLYLSPGDVLKFMDGHLSAGGKPDTAAVPAPASAQLSGTAQEIGALRELFPRTRLLENRQDLLQYADRLGLLHVASHAQARANPNESYFLLPEGRLTLSEIYGLSLSPGCLVVLSACQSGLGEKDPGDEPASLATAFSVAGAGTVISSLWEVDDKATAELFGQFYRELKAGKSRLQALESAKRACRAKYPHPYYWAGFTLLGSP